MAVDLVIDADGHCSEPTDELAKWLPPEWVARAPASVSDHQGRSVTLIEGRPTSKREILGMGVSGPFGPKARTGSRAGMKDPVARLVDMDEEGIDVGTKRASTSPSFSAHRSPYRSTAYTTRG
jgi:hypothetical protein